MTTCIITSDLKNNFNTDLGDAVVYFAARCPYCRVFIMASRLWYLICKTHSRVGSKISSYTTTHGVYYKLYTHRGEGNARVTIIYYNIIIVIFCAAARQPTTSACDDNVMILLLILFTGLI